MRVKFTSPFDYVTLRTKQGTPRATVAYKASDEPQTVKREHGEAAVKAGKAVEVDEPAKSDDDAVYDRVRDMIADGQTQTIATIVKSAKYKGK